MIRSIMKTAAIASGVSRLAIPALFCLLAISGPAPASQYNANSPMGVNLWDISDWNTDWSFVDYFKKSRPFASSSASAWSDNRPLDLDANGYPKTLQAGQFAMALMMWGDGGSHPEGDYVCLYDGEGTIQFSYNAVVKSSAPGRIVVNVKAFLADVAAEQSGVRLTITETNPANPVHNIRFIAPGYEATYATQIFNPQFLDKLKEFRCIRFMNWMNTGGDTTKNWADRPTTATATFAAPKGVCVEYLVELCNRLNCDGWFSLPFAATDDYYRNFATYVRDHLNPGLKAYYEYNNEVWNGGVTQGAGYCQRQGEALGLGTGWTAQHHYWAKRMTEMLTIIEQVYAGKMNQCVRVMATQWQNTGVTDGLLNYYNGKNHADAIAVAPYFNAGFHTDGTVQGIIDSCAAYAAATAKTLKGDSALAAANNLQLITYESGLDVMPSTFGWTSAIAAQVRFDPRMEGIYTTYLNALKKGGNSLIMHYTFCDQGWGMMNRLDQDTLKAPSYMAALHFIRTNPRWWSEQRTAVVPHKAVHNGAVASDMRINVRQKKGVLCVSLSSNMPNGPYGLSITDMLGKKVFEGNVDPRTGEYSKRVGRGLYLVKVQQGGHLQMRTALVQ